MGTTRKLPWLPPSEPPSDAENLYRGVIAHRAYLGNFLYFFVSVNDHLVRVQVPHSLPQTEGQTVYLHLNPEKCVVLL